MFLGSDIMPELPEVEKVKMTLKKQILNKKITNLNIYYEKIIQYPTSKEFKKNITKKIDEYTKEAEAKQAEYESYKQKLKSLLQGQMDMLDKNE
jgi:formamidopyrimidine-DNA glycosylase